MKLKILITMLILTAFKSAYAQQVFSTSLTNQGSTGLAAQIEERNKMILLEKNPDMLDDTVNKIDEFEQNFVYQEIENKRLRSEVLKEQLAKVQNQLQQINTGVKKSTYRYKSDTQEEYEARLISNNQKVQKMYIELKKEETRLTQEISKVEMVESRSPENVVYDERTERIRQRMEYINSQRNK